MDPEDYVPYPVALALKKAGFDWPCDHCYAKTSESEHEFIGMATSRDYNKPRAGESPFLSPICSAVPLWQAQKWLRNVHSIHIQIAPARDGKTEKISWHMVGGYRILELMGTSDFVVAVPYSEIDHCSYESALSAGIAAALELIEKKGE